MGIFQPEYVIVRTFFDDKGTKKVDDFIKKSNRKHKMFYKGKQQTNGNLSYWMDWDGSKEGWDTSNRYDKLRKKFIDVCEKNLEYAKIIKVFPSGDIKVVANVEEKIVVNL